MKALVILLVAVLPDTQDRLAPLLERWRSGREEERLQALRDASRLRKDVGEAALAAFSQQSSPGRWTRPELLLELVSQAKIPSWYGLLVPLLADSQAAIRARALEELAGRGFRRFSGDVVALLRDPDSRVAWQAAYTLVEMGAQNRVPQIAMLLKDPLQSIRTNVLYALGRLGTREHGALVAPLLEDADIAVVLAAVQSLGRFKAQEYAAKVARFLASNDPKLRQAAIASLASMGAGQEAGKIAERLTDTETLVRWEALRALGALRARDYAGQIVAAVDEDGGLAPALEAMGALGLRELAPHILPFLKTPDPGIRWRAVKALGDVDAKDDAGSVVEMLKDEDSFVRLCALQALGAMGARDRAGAMLALLRDEEPEVCQVAAEESSLLATPEQIQTVSRLALDADAFVRWNALNLLVGAGAKDALAEVLAKLRGGNPIGRDTLWALGRLGGKDQATEVTRALGNEELLVRQQAAFTLARISDRPEALEAARGAATGAYRLSIEFALIRLGRRTRAEAAQLLIEFVQHQDEPGYELFPDEVFDALAAGFEKELTSRLQRDVHTSKRVESVRLLQDVLAPAGVSLVEELPELRRRMPAGSTLSAGRLLEWSFGPGMRLVPGRGRTAILETADAIEAWQKRLDSP